MTFLGKIDSVFDRSVLKGILIASGAILVVWGNKYDIITATHLRILGAIIFISIIILEHKTNNIIRNLKMEAERLKRRTYISAKKKTPRKKIHLSK